MQSKQIDASDAAAVRPFATWRSGVPWQYIRQDYLAVHARRDARLAAEAAEEDDPYQESAQDRARHQHVLNQGAVLVHKILDLVAAEPIAGVRDAAVRYLLNRDFESPEAMSRELDEVAMLHAGDTERNELRPPEFQCYSTCEAAHGRGRKELR